MSISTRSDGRAVIALIATRHRPELLLSRAIPSVLAQGQPPDLLLVVVDGSRRETADLRQRVKSACEGRVHATVIRNTRTACRAAGAWNTGLDFLQRPSRFDGKLDLCYVAVIDDDDAWEPDHLRLCFERATSGNFGMVAAGLIRHESVGDEGRRQSVPERLCAREQFIRGQHIQGSNLFVRLDMLLAAGMFDERLPSCTDRDLCIRLADLPGLRFGSVGAHTVHHYADARPHRLSAARSRTKHEGLDRFWWKHAARFDEGARREAAARAIALFGWSPSEPTSEAVTLHALRPVSTPVSLVAGFVTDSQSPERARGLLSDLLALSRQPGVARLSVVVVENGPIRADGCRPLRDLVEESLREGLDVQLVDVERQHADWEANRLLDTSDPRTKRLQIAETRSILSSYVARVASEDPRCWAWILDDDKRLSITVDLGNGTTVERPTPDLETLRELQSRGIDFVLGPDCDAAPLPFTATVRTQLLDLLYNLRTILADDPTGPWPDRSAGNTAARAGLADTYYDLARATEHLETPLWMRPVRGGCTASDMLTHIAARVGRLLAGEQVFRSLVVDAASLPAAAARASIQRGGSAIFFRPALLLSLPHTLSRIGSMYLRRSDMLVSLLARDHLGCRVEMHPAAGVRHDRSCTSRSTLDGDSLALDILGYGLYRAVDSLMQQRDPARRREPLLAWTETELTEGCRLVKKYAGERLAAFTLSAARINGLAEGLRDLITVRLKSGGAWESPAHRLSLEQIASEMDRICNEFRPSAVRTFAARIRRGLKDEDIRGALSSMDGLIGEYRATHPSQSNAAEDQAAARQRRAVALVRRTGGTDELRLLGMGGEGVVLTDGRFVYKVFDLLKSRGDRNTRAALIDLQGQPEASRHLIRPERVLEQDGTLILVTTYEQSEAYTGGHGPELIALLRECKAAGIVCRNMHPKNLRVFASGLKLVDYGADIRPITDGGYRSMAERAWLTWRWPHRPDLEEVMRRALHDKTLPELAGFERFWAALTDEHPSATRIVADIVEPIIAAAGPRTVLDYGCGRKAHLVRRLAASAIRAIGFDPGPGMTEHWAALPLPPEALRLTTDSAEALGGGPFDAVVCSLVLCELGDGEEYDRVLSDVNAAAAPGGLILITVCNPLATFGGPTPLHRSRDLPPEAAYEESFWYTENAETGVPRREFHRPLDRLERDLLRHGLRVHDRIESRSVDLVRFEPASDFLTLVCRPIRTPERRVSLLIKTCAMEAATIERQVEHLVNQLTGPRAFIEHVLAIDSRQNGFTRQYADGQWEALFAAAERLRRRGLIDRIVLGPSGPASVATLNMAWFGTACTATHSVRGAPIATPLHALEACAGEYVLQVDSDLLIGRKDREHDYLGDMIAAMEDHAEAVTVSLNIAQASSRPYSSHDEMGTPWRVECRGCLFHRARLLAARPFPNVAEAEGLRLCWHRSMDFAAAEGQIRSLRGGDHRTFFVHPHNEFKLCLADWMLVLDRVEQGELPTGQLGRVDLFGGPIDWLPRERNEPFVFIITGRNVPPGRARRCLESLAALRPSGPKWGAVIVDDASGTLERESLRLALRPWTDRVTLLQPRERRGQLANMASAIRHVCADSESVMVTLDLDDALLGERVLEGIAAEYERGADVTVGSMLRTDKHRAYPVEFEGARGRRGGNVWQHLRTFRKRLFDAIPDQQLRVEGRYVDVAVDWAFMLPIVETASHPVWLREHLYLYEPSGMGKGPDRDVRERQIGALTSRCARRRPPGQELNRVITSDFAAELTRRWGPGTLFLRHAERPSFQGLSSEERHAVAITEKGEREARRLGAAFGAPVRLFSSPVPRALQTAAAIRQGAGMAGEAIGTHDGLLLFRESRDRYEEAKARLGWSGLMRAWVDGSLPEGVLIPAHAVAANAVSAVLGQGPTEPGTLNIAVTHDFVIIALLASLRGTRTEYVPFLGGAYVLAGEVVHLLELETSR